MNDSSTDFQNILAAAKALLGESVAVVRATGLRFVVVGGWSPFLLNSSEVRHPGSRDVDLLFEEGAREGQLRDAVEALRAAGYVLSAKHDFQLLRVLRVAGERFVFNVDLLHGSQSHAHPELFVDHVSLPIKVSEFGETNVAVRSIVVPVSNFIFGGHAVDYELEYEAPTAAGKSTRVRVPLMDELGTLVTKAESMSLSKRTRDAFDVMLAAVHPRDRGRMTAAMGRLREQHKDAFAELSKLWAFESGQTLRRNVEKFWPQMVDARNWAVAWGALRSMLEDAAVPRPQPVGGK